MSSFIIAKKHYLAVMNRRKFILAGGTVGLGAIAGCSSEGGNPDSSTSTSTSTSSSTTSTTTSTGTANFVLSDNSPKGDSFSVDEKVTFEAQLKNTGDAEGTQNIVFKTDGEVLVDENITLGPGESRPLSIPIEPDTFNAGTWNYSFESENDSIGSKVTITEPKPTYQVRIKYDGEWSGSIGGDGSVRSVDGSGTKTFDIQGDPFIVSANAQKQDDSSEKLTVQILKDGEVIAQRSTSSAYGVAQVTSEDGMGSGDDSSSGSESTGATFTVRVKYDGEWSGSVGSGGSVRSIDGSGTKTITIEGSPSVISANAQKRDKGSGTLTIQILKNGEVVKESSTSAQYGMAQISYSNF